MKKGTRIGSKFVIYLILIFYTDTVQMNAVEANTLLIRIALNEESNDEFGLSQVSLLLFFSLLVNFSWKTFSYWKIFMSKEWVESTYNCLLFKQIKITKYEFNPFNLKNIYKNLQLSIYLSIYLFLFIIFIQQRLIILFGVSLRSSSFV